MKTRRSVWILGLPLLLAAFAAGALAGTEADGPAAREFSLPKVRLVRVRADEGAIAVRGTAGTKAKVTVTGSTADCELVTEVRGDELLLQAKAPGSGLWSSKHCKAGFDVEMPKGLELSASAGSGGVSVSGLKAGVQASAGSGSVRLADVSGSLQVKVGSGKVEGEAASARLDVKAGSGDVRLGGLLGSASVKVGSGEVRLSWAKAPSAGLVDVKTGSGDVVLEFPEDTKLAADVLTGSGSFKTELGDTPGAAFRVSVKGGSADISIRKTLPAR